MTSSGTMAVRVGGLHGTIVALTRREWYAAVLEVAREAVCVCEHPAYAHRVQMLASNITETCDNATLDAALRSTCRCRALELEAEVAKQVSEWVVARRVGEALVG